MRSAPRQRLPPRSRNPSAFGMTCGIWPGNPVRNAGPAIRDSCVAMADRLSKNSTTALISATAVSSKPECPAGLRDGRLSLLIFQALSKLTPEDQTQHEPNSERREYCFCWIFTDILLGIFLERPNAAPSIAPRLSCFAASFAPGLLRFSAVLFGESACG